MEKEKTIKSRRLVVLAIMWALNSIAFDWYNHIRSGSQLHQIGLILTL